MHLNTLVVDGVVVTGSYTFSANAENQITVDDPVSVAACAAHVGRLVATYERNTS